MKKQNKYIVVTIILFVLVIINIPILTSIYKFKDVKFKQEICIEFINIKLSTKCDIEGQNEQQ